MEAATAHRKGKFTCPVAKAMKAVPTSTESAIDKIRDLENLSLHDQERAHHQHVFLAVPVRGGSTDHIVNKPPSGGFVVSAAS